MGSTTFEQQAEARLSKPKRGEDYYLRWLWRMLYSPDGVNCVCPKCNGVHRFHRVAGRRAFACDRCGHHLHPAKGTLLNSSNLRLASWFKAASLVLSSNGGIPSAELANRLPVTYKTAARLKCAIAQAIEEGGHDALLLRKMWAEEDSLGGTLPPACDNKTAAGHQSFRTRDRITAAACHAFAERGLSSTRVADIARSAGVSTAIIHYYFRTKDEVFLAALTWAARNSEARVREIVETEPDHLARVRQLVDIAVPGGDVLRDEYRLWLDVYAIGRLEPKLFDTCTALSDNWRISIETVVEEGTRAGAFEPIAAPWEIAHRVVNLLDGLSFRLVVGYAGMSVEFVRTFMSRFMAEQLGVPQADLMCTVPPPRPAIRSAQSQEPLSR